MQALISLTQKMVDYFFALVPRSKPSSSIAKKALLIAHRGVHNNQDGIIENTHRAFQRAKELGCWGIECDVHSTADGVLIVHHDPHLKRLWQHDVLIAQLSFNELKTLAPEIPSLTEVVKEYGHSLHLLIELKTPIINPRALFQALEGCEPVLDYHLLTLEPQFFNNLELFPKAALLLVAVHNNVNQLCNLSIEKHYGGLLGNYLLLTGKYYQRLERAQQVVGVGFVNSKNSLYRELNRGIRWLFTDEAERVIAYLHQLTKP